jgi:two-component system response regulator AtoC
LSESEIPVIFRGEAGTGKELAARTLHFNSRRADDPFYTINCAVLRKESAFDDVFAPILRNSLKRDRRIDSQRLRSKGGTLFLKKIDRMEPALCDKLMEHLGPPLDIRIFLSVRTGAQNPADGGNPIGELMGRIDPWEVHIPPLRERGGDIEHLANFFLSEIRSETHRPNLHITREALKILSDYAWPGNIRELKNVIRQASHMSEAPAIDIMDLPPSVRSAARGIRDYLNSAAETLPPREEAEEKRAAPVLSLKETESRLIRETLEYTRGNITRAAALLKISRSALYRRIEKLQISRKPVSRPGLNPLL